MDVREDSKMRAIFLALLLAGCAPQIVYKDRIVEVPTIIMEKCPNLPIIADLVFSTDSLTDKSSNQDIARAYAKDVEACHIKVEQYKAALKVQND